MAEKDWKKKYFESLKELEDQENTWYKLEKLLRKAISRLATSAKGIDSRLDALLQRIQKCSRDKDDEQLDKLLEQLSELLASLEGEVSTESPEPPAVAEATTDASEHDMDVKTFVARLLTQLCNELDVQAQLEQLAQQVNELEPEVCLLRLTEVLQSLLHKPDDSLESVPAVLQTLLEKINLLHGQSEQLEKLQQQLQSNTGEDWSAFLDELLSEIYNLIKGINQDKQELENLILDVTRQLDEISEVLLVEQQDSETGRRETELLQQTMRGHVQSMEREVASQTDIGALRNVLQGNLSQLKSSVDDYVSKDHQRYLQSEKRNQQLRQQLDQMEQESAQLQQSLKENRLKLLYDSLTGVRNRMAYDEALQQELLRWQRYQDTFSFAILDIDHFKRINDEYGHNAGDKALQLVAKMMSGAIRKSDSLFRIGGEEFVLLMPKTALQQAQPLVEKIRRSVDDANFHFRQKLVTITISAGLTEVTADDRPESIYERADKALYRAKHEGRNRLVSVSSD